MALNDVGQILDRVKTVKTAFEQWSSGDVGAGDDDLYYEQLRRALDLLCESVGIPGPHQGDLPRTPRGTNPPLDERRKEPRRQPKAPKLQKRKK